MRICDSNFILQFSDLQAFLELFSLEICFSACFPNISGIIPKGLVDCCIFWLKTHRYSYLTIYQWLFLRIRKYQFLILKMCSSFSKPWSHMFWIYSVQISKVLYGIIHLLQKLIYNSVTDYEVWIDQLEFSKQWWISENIPVFWWFLLQMCYKIML